MPSAPPKVPVLVWGGLLIAAALAFPTWKFGPRFLRQFFISPFQFFIVPLWLIAYFSVRSGVMPTRSGPSIRRDEDPRAFSQNLWFTVIMGVVMFGFNLCVSWAVASRW